jgi:hypothetical protein
MTQFDILLNVLIKASNIIIEDWCDESDTDYGMIQFRYIGSGKTYRLLWEDDIIIKNGEVT